MRDNPIRDAEVAWYRKNGKYPLSRIVRDKHYNEYVISDWSWNKKNDLHEVIEPAMNMAGVYTIREAGEKRT